LSLFCKQTTEEKILEPGFGREKVGALALTEPGAGSDAASIKTDALPSGSDYILNGEKRFITNGGVADFLFVLQ